MKQPRTTKEFIDDLHKLSKRDLFIMLWVVRILWVLSKVKAFGRKFFPYDPMFYNGNKAA